MISKDRGYSEDSSTYVFPVVWLTVKKLLIGDSKTFTEIVQNVMKVWNLAKASL